MENVRFFGHYTSILEDKEARLRNKQCVQENQSKDQKRNFPLSDEEYM